jgi:hypothetical protein
VYRLFISFASPYNKERFVTKKSNHPGSYPNSQIIAINSALYLCLRTLHLHPLQHHRLPRIRHQRPPNLQLLPPLRPPLRHLNIILQNQAREHQLDFIRRKEAAGARVAAVSKREIRLVGRDELVARVVCCAAPFAQLRGTEAVEGRGRGIQARVGVDGCGGDFEYRAGGDELTIREGDGFEDAAGEGCCWSVLVGSWVRFLGGGLT